MADARSAADLRRLRPNLKDDVAAHLRERILSGALRPGAKINQDAVAEQLGVSKLPVREALITLEGQGLVDTVARRGAFVAPLTAEDVLDHYAVYGLVSGLAAERAATTISDEALGELETLVQRMEASGSPSEQEELNFAFHRLINRAGGSRRLLSVIRLLAGNIPARYFEFTVDWPERAQRDHREILAALCARDGPAAAAALNDHLRAGGEYAVRMLRDSGFWSPDGGDHLDAWGPASRP